MRQASVKLFNIIENADILSKEEGGTPQWVMVMIAKDFPSFSQITNRVKVMGTIFYIYCVEENITLMYESNKIKLNFKKIIYKIDENY